MDLTIKPTGTRVADAAVAATELPRFATMVRETIAAAPAAALELANTVTVTPGGKTFSTIQAAINSITDAKLQKQYVVQVGPGTYKEVVTCKPYVFLQGAGVGATVVIAPAAAQQIDKGTIKGASNSAVQNMSVVSAGTSGYGAWAAAIDCNGTVNFDIEYCGLEADNGSSAPGGTNLVALSIDYSAIGGGSQVNIAYSTIIANGGAQPLGVSAFANSFVGVTDSKIIAENADASWGAASSNGSTINLYNCTVSGSMSLVLSDSSAHITATDCHLNGPYSTGVVVNSAP